jgi:hypothetical protein
MSDAKRVLAIGETPEMVDFSDPQRITRESRKS